MQAITISFQKVMSFKDSKEEYMEGFRERNGKEEI